MWFLVQPSWQWRLTYHNYPAMLWFECEKLPMGSGVWTLGLHQADDGILEVYGIFWRQSPTGGNEPLGTGPIPLPVSSLLPDCRYCVTTYSSFPLHDELQWQLPSIRFWLPRCGDFYLAFLFWFGFVLEEGQEICCRNKVTYRSPQILVDLHLKQIENLHKLTGSSEIPGPSINLLALTSISCILSLPSHGEWENNNKPLVFLF